MADPFVGEIRIFAGNFAPNGWSFCNGQLLAISQNQALFALIGTFYGGDGVTTFQLPDLRGRVPIHQGTSPVSGTPYTTGEKAGVENVTLATNQIPPHRHNANANGAATVVSPANAFWSTDPFGNTAAYYPPSSNGTMNASAVGSSGGSQPHDNMQPFLAINYIIALFGIFPSRS
jgi:microcystin-dependent protein